MIDFRPASAASRRVLWLAVLAAGLCASLLVPLAQASAAQPVVAIIIDDLGNTAATDRAVIALPGPVACAFLPHTPYAKAHAKRAHAAGKEVLLHLPLEALGHNPLGPGGVRLHVMKREFADIVRADIASIPDVDGVNNHMGSLITQNAGDMVWLMKILRDAGLFFIDSRTTARTVAYKMAVHYGVPAASRNVFLDDVRKPEAIKKQLQQLVTVAKKNGTAIAIGHPYPVTLKVLKKQLPKLADKGVQLVALRTIIKRRAAGAPDPGRR